MAPDTSPRINIKDYIVDKYAAAKCSTLTLKVVFNEEWKHSLSSGHQHAQQRCENLTFPFARSAMAAVTISEAAELVEADEDLNTKRIEQLTLDRSTHFANVAYEPGDTIAIMPSNPDDIVEVLLKATGCEQRADEACRITLLPPAVGKKPGKLPPYIPTTSTPREILRDCLNLHAVPKKQFLSSMAQYCEDNDERDFLSCVSSKEAAHHYNALFLEQGRTLVDLLEACPTCKLPFELLLEHLPRLLPRPYSIANSPLTNPDGIRIIYSVRNGKAGVTTAMLSRMAAASSTSADQPAKVYMYFREPNMFRYTAEDVDANQILIAIGTGLAPFVGFLEHKQQLCAQMAAAPGETWLFVGATTEESIVHRDFLMELRIEGSLQRYYESLSRVPDAPYHYVQDILEEKSEEFVEFLMRPETTLYLCADGAHISKCLQAAVASCMMRELHLEEVVVMEMIKSFRSSGKYREDLWL